MVIEEGINMQNVVPRPTNLKEAKDFIDNVDDDLRHEMLQRALDMLIVNLGLLQNKYQTMYVGEFDSYLYIYLMDKMMSSKTLLEDYLNGHFTGRDELF